jgi:hypothetical protein
MSVVIRKLVSAGLVSLCALACALLFSSTPALATGDANQASCPFETEASPGFRAYLPDCRAYELVTPPYKAGATLLQEPDAISPDGSHVITGAGGSFAGADNYWINFASNPGGVAYELTRGATGWQTTVLTPPAVQYPHSTLLAVSGSDFGTTLWAATRTVLLSGEDFFLRNDNGDFLPIGPGRAPQVAAATEELYASTELSYVGASSDLTHSLFTVEAFGLEEQRTHHGHSNLWPGDTTEPYSPSLYEYVYNGAASPEPTLVGVKNEGPLRGGQINEHAELISKCGTKLGSGTSTYNAISENGETVFFTALECATPAVNELYARIAGEHTVAISEPSHEDCEACNTTTELAGARFQGASQNGEKVFFTTEQGLLPGQTGKNLYEYDFNGPAASSAHPDGKISLISSGSSEPEVLSVVRIAEDGERVYFVAKGKLTGPDRVAGRSPEETEPVPGADNLYVYEPDPDRPGSYRTVFIATLLTPGKATALEGEEEAEKTMIHSLAEIAGQRAFEEARDRGAPEREARELKEQAESREEQRHGTLGPSGTVEEDESVWSTTDRRPAQATPDGGSLVFLSSEDITAEDASKVPQLFEYNAASESLTRVSIGHGGPSSGNVDTFSDSPHMPEQSFAGVDLPTSADTGLAVSEEGSKVFFTSTASLAPQAEPEATNVYEYRDGNVYLVSGGDDTSTIDRSPAVGLFGIDPSGSDAFFTTAEHLVPQDGETQQVLYDAREEGGFPAPTLETGCIGETCRGASGATPQLQLPDSANQAGGGNLTSSTSPPPAVVQPKSKPKAKQCKKGFVKKKNKCVKNKKFKAKKAIHRKGSK